MGIIDRLLLSIGLVVIVQVKLTEVGVGVEPSRAVYDHALLVRDLVGTLVRYNLSALQWGLPRCPVCFGWFV